MQNFKSSTAGLVQMVAMIHLQCCLIQCDASKILFLPIWLPSHVSSLSLIAENLISRGHEVHFLLDDQAPAPSTSVDPVAADPRSPGGSGRAPVVHRYSIPHQDVVAPELFSSMMIQKSITSQELLSVVIEDSRQRCRGLFSDDNEPLLVTLENLEFDAVVVDLLFMSKCFYLLPHRLQRRRATAVVTYADAVLPLLVRVPWLASFVPDQLSTLTDRMTFVERLENFAWMVVHRLASLAAARVEDSALLDRYRHLYGHFDSLDELVTRSSIWLATRDVLLDYAKPSMPNIIDVGGLTTGPASGRPLTKNLRDFLDGAERGVILASFGTLMSELPQTLTERFLAAFGSLEADGYRVLWKFDNSRNESLPVNVMAVNWLPQKDVLAHHKTRLFITHCGNNGQFEALYFGVPMLGFPIYSDQPYNARRIEHRGYGLAMNIHSFTAHQLIHNIHQILDDPGYRQRTARASEIFRSRPETPVERATYWIELVIRFGSDHLRSAGTELYLFQYYMLDVLVFLLLMAALSVLCVAFICGRLFSKLCRCSSKYRLRTKTKSKSN